MAKTSPSDFKVTTPATFDGPKNNPYICLGLCEKKA